MRVFEKCHQGVARQERETGRGVEGKIKWKLSKVNTRAVSRGQDKLIGKFKIAAGHVISIRGQVMEYTYIPTGIPVLPFHAVSHNIYHMEK